MKPLLRVHALLISLLLDDSDSDSDSGDSDSGSGDSDSASSEGSDTSSDASYSADSSSDTSDSGGGGDTVSQAAQPQKRLNPEDLNPGDFGDIPPNFPNPPGQ
ncbi:MAG: hypothetical protein HXX08_19830 [Chloroflexi bacterium]|uniref:Uncharacterized protein n=1 Tax=Candidatus Chlorohelix allophototropha TaxID=3003348 RepID=A0A8T7M831_9CHLR|nr:hypothetical protein [Chloroflexota bacterium]WJW68052.1 hypothetical protein OZ401_003649 [Chloroflexota bacterium L227-S17]